MSERPSKRTVDEPSFLARSQTVATPSAAMSIAELITRPRPAGLSSGELLLGHGSPFLCRGRLFERYRPKWRGAWLSRLLHRDRSSPCSRPLALCPAGPLVLRAELGRLPSLVPYRQRASLPRQPPRQLPTRLCPGVSGFLGTDIAPAVLDGEIVRSGTASELRGPPGRDGPPRGRRRRRVLGLRPSVVGWALASTNAVRRAARGALDADTTDRRSRSP